MTEPKLDLNQEIEDFVQLRLDAWMLENPEPEQIVDEKPKLPDSEFLKIAGGFFVTEICDVHAIRFHVTIPQRRAMFIDIRRDELKLLIEQLLILESDMQDVYSWQSVNGQRSDKLHRWRSERGQLVSDARREFMQSHEG